MLNRNLCHYSVSYFETFRCRRSPENIRKRDEKKKLKLCTIQDERELWLWMSQNLICERKTFARVSDSQQISFSAALSSKKKGTKYEKKEIMWRGKNLTWKNSDAMFEILAFLCNILSIYFFFQFQFNWRESSTIESDSRHPHIPLTRLAYHSVRRFIIHEF